MRSNGKTQTWIIFRNKLYKNERWFLEKLKVETGPNFHYVKKNWRNYFHRCYFRFPGANLQDTYNMCLLHYTLSVSIQGMIHWSPCNFNFNYSPSIRTKSWSVLLRPWQTNHLLSWQFLSFVWNLAQQIVLMEYMVRNINSFIVWWYY